MPYVPTNPDDEEQKKNQGAPEDVAGTDSAGLGGTGSQNMPSPQQSGLSGWTDVKAYLDANKDQTAGTAKTLGDKLSGDATSLQNEIGQGETDFENNANAGKVDYDPNLVDSALANPSDFVKDQSNVDKFAKMRDASYGGPADLTATGQYGTLQGKVKEGQARAGLIDTEGGRETLLNELPGNRTKGMNTLDSMLLSGSPESRDVLKSGASKFGTLQDYLDQEAGKAAVVGQAAKSATDAASATTKSRLDDATKGFQSDLDARLAAARAKATADQTRVRSDLFNGGNATPNPTLTDEDYAALGVSRDELNPVMSSIAPLRTDYGVGADVSPFLTMQSPDALYASAGDVANPEDFAKAAALAQLAGGNSFLAPGTGGGGSGIQFDKSGASNATSGALRDLDMKTVQSALNSSPAYGYLGMEGLRDPAVVAALQKTLTGADLTRFNNALQRLGIVGGGTTYTPPTQPLTPDEKKFIDDQQNKVSSVDGRGFTAF